MLGGEPGAAAEVDGARQLSPARGDEPREFLGNVVAEHVDELLVERLGETVEIGDEIIARRAVELLADHRVEQIALDRIGVAVRQPRAAEADRRVAMAVGAEQRKGGARDRRFVFRVGLRRVAIGGKCGDVVGDDHGLEEARQGVAARELLVDADAAGDLGRHFARGAGKVAGEEQSLAEPGVDERVPAASVDRATPVRDRLGVTPLLEAQQAEAERGLGELRVALQRRRESAFGGLGVGERVGDQRQPEPGAGESRVERQRAFERRTRLGGLAAGMKRRAEVEP